MISIVLKQIGEQEIRPRCRNNASTYYEVKWNALQEFQINDSLIW